MNFNLFCGDCIEKMLGLPDKSVDMILCDPPYGTTRNKWDVIIPFDLMWEQFCRVAKDNAAIVIFGSGMFTADCMRSAPKGLWRYNLIWQKTSPTGFYNAKKMPLRSHDVLMVFYKHLPTYNPQMTHGHERKVSLASHKRNSKASTNYGLATPTSYDSTDRYPKSVWTFKTDKQKCAVHPTQKPIHLCEEIILTYTNEGDTVLDPTFGSGSTGVACANTQRKFIGIEKGIIEYAIGARRIEDAFYCNLHQPKIREV